MFQLPILRLKIVGRPVCSLQSSCHPRDMSTPGANSFVVIVFKRSWDVQISAKTVLNQLTFGSPVGTESGHLHWGEGMRGRETDRGRKEEERKKERHDTQFRAPLLPFFNSLHQNSSCSHPTLSQPIPFTLWMFLEHLSWPEYMLSTGIKKASKKDPIYPSA